MVEKIGITLTNLTLKSIEKIKQSVIFLQMIAVLSFEFDPQQSQFLL